MSILSADFNILKWTAKTIGAGMITAAIMLAQKNNPAAVTDDFNKAANPAPNDSSLVIRTPQGAKTYSKPGEIRRALARLPFRESSTPEKPPRPAASAESPRPPPNRYLAQYVRSDPLTPVIDRLIFSESGNDPDAISHTGARGLGQFVGATLLEQLWHNRDLLPARYDPITQNVIRYTKRETGAGPVYGWKIRDGYSRKKVMDLAHDPVVGRILTAEYSRHLIEQARDEGYYKAELGKVIRNMERSSKYKNASGRRRIAHMRAQMDRPFTAVDLKIMYVFGLGGGVKALVALADPEKAGHRAADYTPRHVVNANPDIFYKDGARKRLPRTLSEMHQYFAERVGTARIPKKISRADSSFMMASNEPKPR